MAWTVASALLADAVCVSYCEFVFAGPSVLSEPLEVSVVGLAEVSAFPESFEVVVSPEWSCLLVSWFPLVSSPAS